MKGILNPRKLITCASLAHPRCLTYTLLALNVFLVHESTSRAQNSLAPNCQSAFQSAKEFCASPISTDALAVSFSGTNVGDIATFQKQLFDDQQNQAFATQTATECKKLIEECERQCPGATASTSAYANGVGDNTYPSSATTSPSICQENLEEYYQGWVNYALNLDKHAQGLQQVIQAMSAQAAPTSVQPSALPAATEPSAQPTPTDSSYATTNSSWDSGWGDRTPSGVPSTPSSYSHSVPAAPSSATPTANAPVSAPAPSSPAKQPKPIFVPGQGF